MARVTGLEPATSGVTGRHSNQLSYTRVRVPPKRCGGGVRVPPCPVKRSVGFTRENIGVSDFAVGWELNQYSQARQRGGKPRPIA